MKRIVWVIVFCFFWGAGFNPTAYTGKVNAAVGNKKIIGKWKDVYTEKFLPGGNYITIYKKDNRIFLERNYSDGSGSVAEMKIIKVGRQERYVEKKGSPLGEYYVINSRGNLGVYDNQGLIFTGKKVK